MFTFVAQGTASLNKKNEKAHVFNGYIKPDCNIAHYFFSLDCLKSELNQGLLTALCQESFIWVFTSWLSLFMILISLRVVKN